MLLQRAELLRVLTKHNVVFIECESQLCGTLGLFIKVQCLLMQLLLQSALLFLRFCLLRQQRLLFLCNQIAFGNRLGKLLPGF